MTKLGLDLDIKNEKSAYAAAVTVALIVASVLLVTYYAVLIPQPDKYTTIYLLDTNKKATNYPEVLVADVNSTFNVYVVVENHLGRTLTDAQVQVKVANYSNPTFPVDSEPIQTLTGTVEDGGKWESPVTVTLNVSGEYLVAFELWVPNESGALEYSGNLVALNLQVIEENSNLAPG
jgi:uncharacterized membrane protein